MSARLQGSGCHKLSRIFNIVQGNFIQHEALWLTSGNNSRPHHCLHCHSFRQQTSPPACSRLTSSTGQPAPTSARPPTSQPVLPAACRFTKRPTDQSALPCSGHCNPSEALRVSHSQVLPPGHPSGIGRKPSSALVVLSSPRPWRLPSPPLPLGKSLLMSVISRGADFNQNLQASGSGRELMSSLTVHFWLYLHGYIVALTIRFKSSLTPTWG